MCCSRSRRSLSERRTHGPRAHGNGALGSRAWAHGLGLTALGSRAHGAWRSLGLTAQGRQRSLGLTAHGVGLTALGAGGRPSTEGYARP